VASPEAAAAVSTAITATDIGKAGGGAVLGFCLYKALDIIRLLIKKRRAEDRPEGQGERRVNNTEILTAVNAAVKAAELAKDSGADSVTAFGEVLAEIQHLAELCERTHEKANRIMEIQHELAASLTNVSQGIAQLGVTMQAAVVLLTAVSKDLAVSMATINASLKNDSKGN